MTRLLTGQIYKKRGSALRNKLTREKVTIFKDV